MTQSLRREGFVYCTYLTNIRWFGRFAPFLFPGTLTSRLWVQEMDDRIRFLRPLYNDDITTSDRKFELLHGTDDDKIALVKVELHRLRQLAALDHPFVPESKVDEDPLEDVRKRLRENRPRRKFFGM